MEKSDPVENQGESITPYNVFPKILKGELPASFVYKDEWVSAFMDVQPITPGHVLVIPNKSAATLAELDAEYGARMFQVAQQVAAAIRNSDLRCEGVNLILADGAPAGQTVFYMHLHVIPRFKGDGFGIQFPENYNDRPHRDELERYAQTIQSGLSRFT